MGLFSDSKQTQIEKAAANVQSSIMTVGNSLDRNGGKLNNNIQLELQTLESHIVEFLRLSKLYQSSVHSIRWNGHPTMLMGIVMMINGIVQDIQNSTGYRFTRL